jgi:hypothetical protein
MVWSTAPCGRCVTPLRSRSYSIAATPPDFPLERRNRDDYLLTVRLNGLGVESVRYYPLLNSSGA